MIAAIAHQLGHETAMYDLTTIPNGKEIPFFQSKLGSFSPDMLAVSCRSNEWPFIKHLLRSVDAGNILKVFGGPHTTSVPEEVISIADIAVIGEGEDTFREILERITSAKDITDIAGCWVKQDGRIIKNEMRNLISDLDKLPFPYWKIFEGVHYYNSYIKRFFKGSKVVGTFEGSRGCPYNCNYCMNNYIRTLYAGKGKWRREKSPERIVQEVQLFRNEYGLDCVSWIDEVVLTSSDRLRKFRDLYASQVGAPFFFMERPENMIDEKVNIISQAGARRVSIGIESGDEDIRKNILNRQYSQETVVSAFRTARKYGLITHAFTMLGFPGEDRNSLKKTYRLLRKAQPDTVQTAIFYPLPRTKLYERVVNEGLFDPGTAMPENYYEWSYLNFPESKKRELLKWQGILTYCSRRILGLFMLLIPSQLILFSRKIYIRFKKESLKKISRK